MVKPSANDIASAYPDAALRLQAAGFVLLHCGVALTGRLTGCEALQEAPAGLGFGDAALKLAAVAFKMTPQTRDGVATADGEVVIPLNFKTPDTPGAGPPPVILRELKPGEPAPSADTLPCADGSGALCVMKRFTWASTPAAASLAGLYGGVVVSCRVGADGSMQGCRAAAASPGAHVDAARFWARRYRAPQQIGDTPTAGAAVRFIILPPGPPA